MKMNALDDFIMLKINIKPGYNSWAYMLYIDCSLLILNFKIQKWPKKNR